jgi:hypothetical protein
LEERIKGIMKRKWEEKIELKMKKEIEGEGVRIIGDIVKEGKNEENNKIIKKWKGLIEKEENKFEEKNENVNVEKERVVVNMKIETKVKIKKSNEMNVKILMSVEEEYIKK